MVVIILSHHKLLAYHTFFPALDTTIQNILQHSTHHDPQRQQNRHTTPRALRHPRPTNGRGLEDDHDLLSGLGKDDIKTNVYEGGFKTWECSMDLAKLIADDPGINNGQPTEESTASKYIPSAPNIHAKPVYKLANPAQLGCGTALPSMTSSNPLSSPRHNHIRFTLADYNHLSSASPQSPTSLLSWAKREALPSANEDDLEITPAL
jgi:protein-histidine N-methyltransferase